MGNKAPSSASSASATVTSATGSSTTSSAVKELIDVKTVGAEKPIDKSDLEKTDSIPASPMKKPEIVPGYVPPKSGVTPAPDPRGVQYKLKVRFIVGNVSKWIQCDQREDLSTHKWMMYVRGDKENPDVSNLVSKVRFLIHPSYHPHDLIEVSQTPFHLTRRGWGEFPARVQIHFKDPRDKPIDVIHHLKLDKTYTGLQTLGAETVLDVWVHNPKFVTSEEKQSQKTEVEEDLENATDNYNMTETSEGWVICHSKSETMRPNVDEPENKEDKFPDASLASVAEPKMVLKSSNTVKPLESGAMSKPFAANGSDGVGAGPLPSAPTPPPAVAKKAVVSPPSTHTTYIRCKDNDGKAYYLPIKILPNNHQKQVTGLSVAAGQLAGKPQRKPPPPQVGVKYKTKVETAVVFNQNYKSQVGQPQNLSGAESAPSEQRPPSVSLLNGRSSNGNTSSSAQQPLSSLIKTNSFSADRTPGISLSLPSSRFSSPQASPNVSRCSSPLGGQPLNNPSPAGTSLLKSVSLLKPGASLLKRNSVVTMQQHQQQSPSATTIVPHHQVFQQQQKTQLQHQQIHSGLNSAISEQLNHHGFPLHAFQSDLEKSVPGVSLGMWNRVLGRCPEDTQAEIENRIAKRGVHLLKKHSDFHYFIRYVKYPLKVTFFCLLTFSALSLSIFPVQKYFR